jgi:hypothetical protein
MAEVMEMFKKDYYPDQIAGRLAEKYPDEPEMRVFIRKSGARQGIKAAFQASPPIPAKKGRGLGGGYGRGSRQKRVYSYFCRQDNKIAPCKMDAKQKGGYAE